MKKISKIAILLVGDKYTVPVLRIRRSLSVTGYSLLKPALKLSLCLILIPLLVQFSVGAAITYDINSTACTNISGWTSTPCGAMIHWGNSAGGGGSLDCPFTETSPAVVKTLSATMYWDRFYSAASTLRVDLNGNQIYNAVEGTSQNCTEVDVSARTTSVNTAFINKGAVNTYKFINNGITWIMISPGANINGYNVQPLIRTIINYADIISSVTVPVQASFVSTTTPTFNFICSADNCNQASATYQLQISSEAFFVGSGLINKTGLAAAGSYKLSGTSPEVLANGQGYYARARVDNAGATTSNWSYINDFSVELSSPPAPALTSPGTDYPAQPEVIATQKPRFDWGMVSAPD